MPPEQVDHYSTLGLDRRCRLAQIRAAYRALVKTCHPDANPETAEAALRIQQLNAAYEVLADPVRRREYDRVLHRSERTDVARSQRIERNISQDVHLGVRELLHGVTLAVEVKDPANSHGSETYELAIPPMTPPGARFRIARDEPFSGGSVDVRVKVRPGPRFKVSGSDLRTDLRVSAQRALQGGTESIMGAGGNQLRLQVPPRARRGEVIAIGGEGLPKRNGARGDLLVRITYRPEVRISRTYR